MARFAESEIGKVHMPSSKHSNTEIYVRISCIAAYCFFLIFAMRITPLFAEQRYSRIDRNSEIDDLRQFLKLRSRLKHKIRPEERSKIQFSFGEYYFKTNAFREAREAFEDYLNDSPDDISSLLANVYLYKIAELKNVTKKKEEIKKQIFEERFVLLFDEYKTLKYTSLFDNEYEILYFVDKIEVFLNGDIFEQINP